MDYIPDRSRLKGQQNPQRIGAFVQFVIGVPSFVLSLFVFGKEIVWPKRVVTSPDDGEPEIEPALEHSRTIANVSWIGGFFLAIWLLGFCYAAVIATFLFLKIGSRENWLISIILSLASWALFYGLFDRTLHLPFPDGVIFDWFDT